jgi:hypothetical protein
VSNERPNHSVALDHTLAWMHANLPPEQRTRETYLELAYWDQNVQLDAESESMLPGNFDIPSLTWCWMTSH